MFTQEIEQYEQLRERYNAKVLNPMDSVEYREYNEILFSSHSCAIEGNSFSVDDTRELKEKGLGMIPQGKSLLEAFEILDHFTAYEYIHAHLNHPLDEPFIKEVNRLVTCHTLSYRCPGAVAGAYTDCDMAAGDTVFGDHEQLIAKIPQMLASTRKAMDEDIHPMIVAARFHGFFEYLHPFRDGNGRTGRLLSNYILLQKEHPLLLIKKEHRSDYIDSLKMIRQEGTDEYLIRLFFRLAIQRMQDELAQKRQNTKRFTTFLF